MLDYFIFTGEILVLLLYFFFFIRITGRKELREATPIDFAYMILFVSVGWDMIIEPDYNMIHIFLSLLTLSAFYVLIDWLTYKSKKWRKIFIGESIVIIENGKIIEKAVKKERLSDEEINSMLRQQGIYDIEKVEKAILEVNGELTVKPKE